MLEKFEGNVTQAKVCYKGRLCCVTGVVFVCNGGQVWGRIGDPKRLLTLRISSESGRTMTLILLSDLESRPYLKENDLYSSVIDLEKSNYVVVALAER